MTKTSSVLLAFVGLSSLFLAGGCSRGGDDARTSPLILRSDDGPVPHVLGGDRDAADPAVVAVLGSEGGCTGTLIAPRYVLTARHCAADGRPVKVSWRTRASDGPRTAATVHLPPASRDLADDIAILELAEPSTVTPIPTNLEPRALQGLSEIRMVGYGISSSERDDYGVRRTGTARATVSRSYVESIRGTGGTCYGDSGGPALAMIDGREMLVGVTSHGTATRCEDGHTRFVRTDTHRAFLAQFLSSEPPKADDGIAGAGAGAGGGGGGGGSAGGGDTVIASANGVTVIRGADGSIRVTTEGGSVVVADNGGDDDCTCDEDRAPAPSPRHRRARRGR